MDELGWINVPFQGASATETWISEGTQSHLAPSVLKIRTVWSNGQALVSWNLLSCFLNSLLIDYWRQTQSVTCSKQVILSSSRDGAALRALGSHQCGHGSRPVFDMWVEFVVGSHHSTLFFPGTLVFLPPVKPTFPNSKSTRKKEPHENQLIEADVASFLNIITFLLKLVEAGWLHG